MIRDLDSALSERILVLDGGLGTMVQALGLGEQDYRGREFLAWKCPLAGCTDSLCLSSPRAVAGIHRAYLQAGADIITTNSFNANAISLQEYGLEAYARRIARAAAQIARTAADEFKTDGRPRFVAGSMGPTSKTASISASVGDSSLRDVTFAALADAYYDQAAGLVEGGADILLLETVFDTLNAKAAIFALERLFGEIGRRLPLMISVTVSQKAGRTLSGQSIEAFWASVKHARPVSVGINCSFGAREMMPHLERLAAVADCYISVHPNAGLPNIAGGYDETPESFAEAMRPYAERGLVNIMGGCCGTTPEFIRALVAMLEAKGRRGGSSDRGGHGGGPDNGLRGGTGGAGQSTDSLQDTQSSSPSDSGRHFTQSAADEALILHRRQLPEPDTTTILCGLETLRIVPEANFINIGERCNVAGSAKFARLIREGDWDGALAIARAQVNAGAQVIDICMDDGLIDGPAAMRRFINMLAGEVEIASVPLMIDSSSWDTIVAGLECCQGKAIVNSISLKEGPQEFLRRASLIRAYGAAAVVMLFDEEGQATSLERKAAVAERAYKLLTSNGFPAQGIIFDPNILAVATGIPEHDGYGLAFIEAVRWIKQNLPLAKISGGVSNLSFAFRGNNAVRAAMHSAFLYHARQAGMDMGIVNPQMVVLYDDIDPHLLTLVEDVILCRQANASERLAEYAARLKAAETAAGEASAAGQAAAPAAQSTWRNAPAGERIGYAMLHGIADNIENDVLEALAAEGSPMAVINKLMMPAMERVGNLFGEGKMFLPQVVKAAAVMKRGVAALEPYYHTGALPQTPPLRPGYSECLPARPSLSPDGDYTGAPPQTPPLRPGYSECLPARPSLSPDGDYTGALPQTSDAEHNVIPSEVEGSHSAPKVVIATVKGDIHDIGKNIVSVVMAVGGCEIIDLGVMVEAATIVEAVRSHNADFVCLSGLITPSLAQMIEVCRCLRQEGISIPVIVGGATTSPMHTAVKIAPEYDGLVVHSPNASSNMQIITNLSGPAARVFAAGIRSEQKQLQQLYEEAKGSRNLVDYHDRLQEAVGTRSAGSVPGLPAAHPSEPGAQSADSQLYTESYPINSEGVTFDNSHIISNLHSSHRQSGVVSELHQEGIDQQTEPCRLPQTEYDQSIRVFHHYDFAAVRKHLNWDMFYAEWGVKDAAARWELRRDAEAMLDHMERDNILDLQGVIGNFSVHASGDDIVLDSGGNRLQAVAEGASESQRNSQPGAAGFGAAPQYNRLQAVAEGASESQRNSQPGAAGFGATPQYNRLPMLRNQTEGEENVSAADFAAAAGRITLFAISAGAGIKAYAERLTARGDQYGAFMAKVLADCLAEALAAATVPAKEGERHAFGYPSCPDHSLKKDVFELLQVSRQCDMQLTESYMIDPAESICGMVIPGASYFAVGKIGQDQLEDYARRRNMSAEQVKSLIPRNIL